MRIIIAVIVLCLGFTNVKAQSVVDESVSKIDSSAIVQQLILKQKEDHKMDSMIRAQLQLDLVDAKLNSDKKNEIELKLKELTIKDSTKKAQQLSKIEALKKSSVGYAVVLFEDTLFKVYTRIGSFKPAKRAEAISERITKLYKDDFYNSDSLKLVSNENGFDIVYNSDIIIMTINEFDALWFDTSVNILTKQNFDKVKSVITKYKTQNSFSNWLKRIGQIALIVVCLGLVIFLINKLFKKSRTYLEVNKDRFFTGLTIKNFKVFSPQKHQEFAYKVNGILRLIVIVLFIYLSLPLLFSVFPETKSFTDTLLGWVISPAKKVLLGILHFLPNLFTIVVIYYITRWAIRGIQFFFKEIESGGITLNGFHKDWATPTFSILKFVLYAFMVVVIFPYLPGSDSAAFQGVSVFLGVLFSLGSSSAITNMIAGLVITYMRPFKIGDRVKIGDVVGDVLEKTMLVTRIRTIKNEEITIW